MWHARCLSGGHAWVRATVGPRGGVPAYRDARPPAPSGGKHIECGLIRPLWRHSASMAVRRGGRGHVLVTVCAWRDRRGQGQHQGTSRGQDQGQDHVASIQAKEERREEKRKRGAASRTWRAADEPRETPRRTAADLTRTSRARASLRLGYRAWDLGSGISDLGSADSGAQDPGDIAELWRPGEAAGQGSRCSSRGESAA